MSKAKQEEVAASEAEEALVREHQEFVDTSAMLTMAHLMAGESRSGTGTDFRNSYSACATMAYASAEALWGERQRRMGGAVIDELDEELTGAGPMVVEALKGADAIVGDMNAAAAKFEKPKAAKK